MNPGEGALPPFPTYSVSGLGIRRGGTPVEYPGILLFIMIKRLSATGIVHLLKVLISYLYRSGEVFQSR